MARKQPNIIYVLADDLGYGDVGCNSPQCRIPTPNLDRLARAGMRFTDAHAAASVCTPSRYALMTGRYAWRSRLKRGIVWQWDGSLIENGRPTVADLLRQSGYRTAAFGKWHLGWDWPTDDGSHPNQTLPFGVGNPEDRYRYGKEHIDFAGRIAGGPVDRGFDSYFGVDVPNFPPYAWFEDDRLVEIPTTEKPEQMYGQPGPACEGWTLERMIPEFSDRAVRYIEARAEEGRGGEGRPYFLYFPLTSPHSPIVPNAQFRGMSGISAYGDFVCEVDWVVGRIMEALDRTATRDDTLIVFTSDNGPESQRPDDEGVYLRAQRTGHYSMDGMRGIKLDAWEGGHRVPFVASWPAVIPEGVTCNQLVCLADLMATCAEITGVQVPEGAGEDSVSMLPLLEGRTGTAVRDHVVHHSGSGKFAVRKGQWVYIDAPSGGDREEPDWYRAERGYTEHDAPAELFNLEDDLAERVNRFRDEPGVVEELSSLLAQARAGTASARIAGDPDASGAAAADEASLSE